MRRLVPLAAVALLTFGTGCATLRNQLPDSLRDDLGVVKIPYNPDANPGLQLRVAWSLGADQCDSNFQLEEVRFDYEGLPASSNSARTVTESCGWLRDHRYDYVGG